MCPQHLQPATADHQARQTAIHLTLWMPKTTPDPFSFLTPARL